MYQLWPSFTLLIYEKREREELKAKLDMRVLSHIQSLIQRAYSSMSLVLGFLAIIATSLVYVGVNLLSRKYNPGGRMPVYPYYAISQWDPDGIAFTDRQCTVAPKLSNDCIIEGLQQSTIGATRTCSKDAGVCIDYDGVTIKGGDTTPFKASCKTPFCGWSQCKISFGDPEDFFVTVTGSNPYFLTSSSVGSYFYMQRSSADPANGVYLDSNGTIAQFYFIPPDAAAPLQILCYTNHSSAVSSVTSLADKDITMLTIQGANNQTGSFINMFVLMENMPISVFNNNPADIRVMMRKILAFGGSNRETNPTTAALTSLSKHSMSAMHKASLSLDVLPLIMITWTANPGGFGTSSSPLAGGYYGSAELTSWTKFMTTWSQTFGEMVQNVVESRLETTNKSQVPFYNWQG